MEARCLFEARKGYWTSDRFIEQMKSDIKIAEFKYPKARHVWIFDHSSCNVAMADDSLDVNRMNVNPEGKQWVMYWDEKVQKMNYAIGVPKGLRVVLEERGVNTHGMNTEKMKKVLGSHSDFKMRKIELKDYRMKSVGKLCIISQSTTTRVWGQSK